MCHRKEHGCRQSPVKVNKWFISLWTENDEWFIETRWKYGFVLVKNNILIVFVLLNASNIGERSSYFLFKTFTLVKNVMWGNFTKKKVEGEITKHYFNRTLSVNDGNLPQILVPVLTNGSKNYHRWEKHSFLLRSSNTINFDRIFIFGEMETMKSYKCLIIIGFFFNWVFLHRTLHNIFKI